MKLEQVEGMPAFIVNEPYPLEDLKMTGKIEVKMKWKKVIQTKKYVEWHGEGFWRWKITWDKNENDGKQKYYRVINFTHVNPVGTVFSTLKAAKQVAELIDTR